MKRGLYLKALRAESGLTQQQVADMTGLHHSTISAYERNAVNIPSDQLEKLAEIYGVSPGDIMSAGSKQLDVFKTLKLTVARVQKETGISDYQELPDQLKGLLSTAALEALKAFYNSLSDS